MSTSSRFTIDLATVVAAAGCDIKSNGSSDDTGGSFISDRDTKMTIPAGMLGRSGCARSTSRSSCDMSTLSPGATTSCLTSIGIHVRRLQSVLLMDGKMRVERIGMTGSRRVVGRGVTSTLNDEGTGGTTGGSGNCRFTNAACCMIPV